MSCIVLVKLKLFLVGKYPAPVAFQPVLYSNEVKILHYSSMFLKYLFFSDSSQSTKDREEEDNVLLGPHCGELNKW